MKKLGILLTLAILFGAMPVKADEGMWLLPLLEKLNIKKMQEMGCKLSAEDIYSINNSSLKDAIVHFGGGCTGEIVSDKGLLFTNHHCGYGAIQKLSSVEHDYLKTVTGQRTFLRSFLPKGFQLLSLTSLWMLQSV